MEVAPFTFEKITTFTVGDGFYSKLSRIAFYSAPGATVNVRIVREA